MMQWKRKHFLITGAAAGIGLEYTRQGTTLTRETEMVEISELWGVVLTVSQADVD